MNQVAKAIERLRPWLPLRESASFSGAFDAIYSGAHSDVVTLWQDALFREQKFDEQKQDLDEEWGAQAKDSQRRSFAVMLEDTHRAQRERDAAVARAEQAGRERDDWRDKAYSASEGMRKAVARAEAAEARADQLRDERDDLKVEVSNLWASAGRKSAQVDKLLREQKKTSEFVPHFKLHRDGSVTPLQDDTPVWTMDTMHEEDVPVALIVTEDAVEEVEVTTEAASWRAGGTGVPISWNLDKLRELRDGALQEWIEVEAIIREVEKREKEEDSVEDAAVAAFKAAWHRADEEGDEGNRVRRGIRAARHVLGQEQS